MDICIYINYNLSIYRQSPYLWSALECLDAVDGEGVLVHGLGEGLQRRLAVPHVVPALSGGHTQV
jgi:hypothetical protein